MKINRLLILIENLMDKPGFLDIELSNIDISTERDLAEEGIIQNSNLEGFETDEKLIMQNLPKESEMEDIFLLNDNKHEIENKQTEELIKEDIKEDLEIDFLKFEEDSIHNKSDSVDEEKAVKGIFTLKEDDK